MNRRVISTGTSHAYLKVSLRRFEDSIVMFSYNGQTFALLDLNVAHYKGDEGVSYFGGLNIDLAACNV